MQRLRLRGPCLPLHVTHKANEYSFEHIIKVVVGPKKQEFSIHKSLAIGKSRYFAQALASSRWKESKTGTFTLEDDNAAIFGCFVNWLYTGKVEYQKTPDAEILLIESYLFGERREAPAFCNAVLDCLHATWSGAVLPTKDAIVLVFSESLEQSALRCLLVDKCVWNGAANALVQEHALDNSIPSGFALALCRSLLLRIKTGGKVTAVPKCLLTANGKHVCDHGTCGASFPVNPEETSPPNCTRPWSCHKCKFCNLNYDTHARTLTTERLAYPDTAPFVGNFCKTYHKHDDGRCISC